MATVYVAIGSNIEPARNVRRALQTLRRDFLRLEHSPVYVSPAVGVSGPDFYNLVARFETALDVQTLLARLRSLEQELGRTRGPDRNAPRTIDFDLLLYGDLIRHDAAVNVPHPDILNYAFVRRPLADLAADLRHPESGRSIGELQAAAGGPGGDLRRVELGAEEVM